MASSLAGQVPGRLAGTYCHSTSGEKHIADIQSPEGITIEFQHSHISADEQRSRELHYGNMIWVVNGARLKRDFPRFRDGGSRFAKTDWSGVFTTQLPERTFPRAWLNCTTPVFFDFSVAEVLADRDVNLSRFLWCLLPGRVRGHTTILKMAHSELVDGAHTGSALFAVESVQSAVEAYLAQQARPENFGRLQWHRQRRTSRF